MGRRKPKRRKPKRKPQPISSGEAVRRAASKAHHEKLAETFASEVEEHGSDVNRWPDADRWRFWAWMVEDADPNDADAVKTYQQTYRQDTGQLTPPVL